MHLSIYKPGNIIKSKCVSIQFSSWNSIFNDALWMNLIMWQEYPHKACHNLHWNKMSHNCVSEREGERANWLRPLIILLQNIIVLNTTLFWFDVIMIISSVSCFLLVTFLQTVLIWLPESIYTKHWWIQIITCSKCNNILFVLSV